VEDIVAFYPPRRQGLLFFTVCLLVLAGPSIWGFLQATRAEVGLSFFLLLLPGLLALIGIPFLAYRLYSLWRATYGLERDAIHIHWGLRQEVIPMVSVLWVRPAGHIGGSVPFPRLRFPGSITGIRRLADGKQVEFLASRANDLVLIATEEKFFLISPEDTGQFLDVYERFMELGSLTPLRARSVYPTFLLARVWADKTARYLLIAGFILSLVILGIVAVTVPSTTTVALRVGFNGTPDEHVPAVQLFLLPVLNATFFLIDFLLGLFFFRGKENPILAYMIWGSGVFTALLFLMAIFFISRSG
jgi:hypothetical protein